MLVLGIESSCDETAAAVVREDGQVLSDVIHSQLEVHKPFGGVVPELASRDHTRYFVPVVERALLDAGVRMSQLDAVAVTHRPGLVGALLVGVQAAKGLAWGAGKPIVGVDHLVGHLFSSFLVRAGELHAAPPAFPFVALLVSGGHTALYEVRGSRPEEILELGATRDDAAGEAFDKVAKLLGLGYPGGPVIDKLAMHAVGSSLELVAPLLHSESLEFSFSGLKTQVKRYLELTSRPLDAAHIAELCHAFQAAVIDVLCNKTLRAAVRVRASHIVLGGGVAANQALRRELKARAAAKGFEVILPSPRSCTDNGAMIAYAGIQRLLRGETDDASLSVSSRTSLQRVTKKGRGVR